MKFRIAEVDIPTSEPFKFDALDRKSVVEFLRDLIKQIEGPFVLALDSPWGTGKTTVVRMLRCSLEIDGFQCVYFNAWKDDYVTDPLIPMVSAIDELKTDDDSTNESFRASMAVVKKAAGPIAKSALKAAIKIGTMGVLDVDEAIESATADAASDAASDLVDAFQKERASLGQFRDELEKAVGKLSDNDPPRPLIFFIDELDRCRPSYAIELLERVKHLFDVPNIVFVLSIDKAQLSASVASVYGDRSDTQEYLRRFFELEFGIPKVTGKKYTSVLIDRFELDDFFAARDKYPELRYDRQHFIDYFSALADVFDLSLRARERCLTMLAMVLHQTAENHFLDPILVAFLLVLRVKRKDQFSALCDGSLAPIEAMKMMDAHPRGKEFLASRSGLVLESYLLAADFIQERSDLHYKGLEELLASTEGEASVRARASEMLNLRGRGVVVGDPYRLDVKRMASKIDIAESLR